MIDASKVKGYLLEYPDKESFPLNDKVTINFKSDVAEEGFYSEEEKFIIKRRQMFLVFRPWSITFNIGLFDQPPESLCINLDRLFLCCIQW